MREYAIKQQASKVLLIGIKLAVLRWLPQRTYNRYLYSQMLKIDDDAFYYYVPNLLECIKLTKRHSSGYRNAHFEIEMVLNDMPLLKPYYNQVSNIVKKHRIKSRLII